MSDEQPGGLCCQRAMGKWCWDHDPANRKRDAKAEKRRQVILDTIEDIGGCKLFYYDRKEDEELPVGAIEEAVAAGEITADEIIRHFARQVRAALARGR